MKKFLSVFYYKLVPLFLKKIICNTIGNFRHRELLALHERPWYAYGLLSQLNLQKKEDSRLTAINLG